MGNWRTVTIVGSCDPEEVPALRAALTAEDHYGPLHIGEGLAGLGDWVDEQMDVSGNLYERDFSIESLVSELCDFIKVAPSLQVKVHCGGDFEDEKCVVTLTVEDGMADRGPPQIDQIWGTSKDEMKARMFEAVRRPPE